MFSTARSVAGPWYLRGVRRPLTIGLGLAVLVALGAGTLVYLRAPGPRHVTPRAVPLAVPAPSAYPRDKGDNGLWLSRHWLHEDPTDAEIERLAQASVRLGITRLYPFLGPPDAQGVPGWRGQDGHHRYQLAKVRHFIEVLRHQAPQLKVLPWTGGLLSRDVVWSDRARTARWLKELAGLGEAGADGVHFDIEPVPDGDPGLLEFLAQARRALGARAHLSVAVPLFRIDSYRLPQAQRLWSFDSLAEVCRHTDELTVMAYDTYETDALDYQKTLTDWVDALERVRGCEVLVGVPSYEDDAAHHRPEVERLDVALRGVIGSRAPWPDNLRGVALYGGWTTDPNEWEVYQALWQGKPPVAGPLPEE